jgi:2-dehydropantoate 2-reductase
MVQLRVAIVGYGAIGHVVERALDGNVADLVRVDRTRAPLHANEPPVDVAIVCVKTQGTSWAVDVAKLLLSPKGMAITLQNGLGNFEQLEAAVGERAAVGVIYVGARLDEKGALHATGPGRAELGRPRDTHALHRFEALVAALRQGGMTVTPKDDPWPSVWRKVVTNAAVNPTSALLGCVNSELLGDRAAARIADGLAREVARVATAAGVAISEEDAVTWWREMAQLTGANRSSMLQDVEAKRVTEIDAICGEVYREGQRRGIAAPLNQAMTLLVASLHPSA